MQEISFYTIEHLPEKSSDTVTISGDQNIILKLSENFVLNIFR